MPWPVNLLRKTIITFGWRTSIFICPPRPLCEWWLFSSIIWVNGRLVIELRHFANAEKLNLIMFLFSMRCSWREIDNCMTLFVYIVSFERPLFHLAMTWNDSGGTDKNVCLFIVRCKYNISPSLLFDNETIRKKRTEALNILNKRQRIWKFLSK